LLAFEKCESDWWGLRWRLHPTCKKWFLKMNLELLVVVFVLIINYLWEKKQNFIIFNSHTVKVCKAYCWDLPAWSLLAFRQVNRISCHLYQSLNCSRWLC
jgi:hypothetical protein